MTSPAPSSSSTRNGWIMVGIQALLFLSIAAWPAAWSPEFSRSLWLSLTLVLLGAVGVVLSALHLGKALTPHPEPNGVGMSARGLYRWMRHPMYTALVVICAGVAIGRGVVVVAGIVVILAVFFDVKARVEEQFLVKVYDGYADYAATTGKFMPGIGKRRFTGAQRDK